MRLSPTILSPSNSQPYIRAAPARDLVGRRRDVLDRRLLQTHFLSEPPGRIDDRTWRAVPTMTPLSSGSPFQRVATNDLACLESDVRWQRRHFRVGLELDNDRPVSRQRRFPSRCDPVRAIRVDALESNQFGEFMVGHIRDAL